MSFLVSLLLALTMASQAPARQQTSAPAKQQTGAPAGQQAGAPAAQSPVAVVYVIGPEDLLTITVFDEADLTNKYRVDSEGMVTFPLVGRIPASGLTIREFQDRLVERLSSGYIKNPQVRVEMDQYKSQSVFVIGEVRTPGKIVMSGTMSLIEALALAGSPTTAASSELIVIHPKKVKPGEATLPDEATDAVRTLVNIKDLQVGKAGQGIVLQDGDTVFVPKAQTFYITGQVRSPGSYVLEPGMTILQAISLAGGLTERGSDRGMKIERIVGGKRQEVDVTLTDTVQPNDTIVIRQRFF
jgi:polysaccharide export outer membrane protein